MEELGDYRSGDEDESCVKQETPSQFTFDVTAEEISQFKTFASYVPMRLTEEERKFLVVLENALDVCEYTDVVDVTFSYTRKSKRSRMIESLVDFLSITSGLLIANNLSQGEETVSGKNLNHLVPLFRDIFEIGRRYKVMNPSKMRNTYGKLMYILMDTQSDFLRDMRLEFVKPILTISNFLKEFGEEALEMLEDPLLVIACRSEPKGGVGVGSPNRKAARRARETLMESRTMARERLLKKYVGKGEASSAVSMDDEEEEQDQDKGHHPSASSKRGGVPPGGAERGGKRGPGSSKEVRGGRGAGSGADRGLSEEDVLRVIESISDNQAYYRFNVEPVEAMLNILTESFSRSLPDNPAFSLELRASRKKINFSSFDYFSGYSSSYRGEGAQLNHDHPTQFTFVLQSLTLWKEIMASMPLLWYCADMDMSREGYRLADTGQGYQRLQSCPHVRQQMSRILGKVQRACGSWVGLSVVHLGDRDVPNALVFIDKYTQVPRILAPIAQCVLSLPSLPDQDPAFHQYVCKQWGSLAGLRMQILSDFFKHGFDGSGDDGGSCIDGRLTSAWNWCSKLQKKPFYYVFMFTGFQGFDGDFK